MSSTLAELSSRIPQFVKRVLSHVRNALAVIGALLLVVAFFVFSKGSEMTRDMDSRARRALGDFIFKVQDRDVASALVIRAPLAAGADHANAEKAMRRRAKEIDLEVVQAQRHSLTAAGGEEKREVTVIGFCAQKTLDAFLVLRPEFGALLPCTIVLVSEPDGQSWAATLNMEILAYGGQTRDTELETKLLSMKDRLLDVMAAAVAVPGEKPTED